MKRRQGLTTIELLIIAAIIGVIVTIGVFNGRRALEGQQENAAVNTVRQTIWQGATAASARGVRTELVRDGRRIVVREIDSGRTLRDDELPAGVSINFPEGQVLVFTPPGRIDTETFEALPDPVVITTGSRSYRVVVSLIGEVKTERQ